MSEPKEWFGAAELAGSPGMPGTERAIQIAAKKNDWLSRPRSGRGGGREYHVSSLPAVTRNYFLRKTVAELPAPVVVEEELPRIDTLATWQRDIMQARLAVCSLLDETMTRTGASLSAAISALLAAVAAGSLPSTTIETLRAANARGGQGRRLVDSATLYRWMADRAKGPAALAPRAPVREPSPVWLAPLLKLYQQPQKPSIAWCLREWGKHYPTIPAPHPRSANRHIAKLPAEIREHGRMGRRALRAVQPFVRRTTEGLWPMDVVTVDGHLFKAYVRHPMTGRKLRPEITTYLDIATRKAVGFSAWLAESQMAIWAALRDMVLDPACGIPALHYSDNGAYRGHQHRAVMERIGSTLMFSEAYRAQARGVIERFNSSVWVPLAKTLPTYVNDDADPEAVKKALAIANDNGANLLGWREFCDAARRALEDYNNRPHAHLKGLRPNEAWARAVSEGWRPTLLDADDLHDLLPSQFRTVNRGWVSLPWGHYFHERLADYHGQRIVVGVHPTDGSRVWCSDTRGVLLCVAVRDGNSRPYAPVSMLEEARAKRESGRRRRLERKMEAVREEGAAVIDLPRADVAVGNALPAPREREEDRWFNSATATESELASNAWADEAMARLRETIV